MSALWNSALSTVPELSTSHSRNRSDTRPRLAVSAERSCATTAAAPTPLSPRSSARRRSPLTTLEPVLPCPLAWFLLCDDASLSDATTICCCLAAGGAAAAAAAAAGMDLRGGAGSMDLRRLSAFTLTGTPFAPASVARAPLF